MAIGRDVLSVLIHNLADIITIHQVDGTTVFESPSAARILGYGDNGLIGRHPFSSVHPRDVEHVKSIFEQLAGGRATSDPIEFRFRHAEGRWIFLEAVGSNLLRDPAISGIVLTSRDITNRKVSEQKIHHAAHYDPLTDLPNRMLMHDRLRQAIALAQRRDEKVAVLFIDLDRFKKVNDSLGHQRGDELLKLVAQRFRACVREMDTLARLGGDEFTIIAPGVDGPRDAVAIAQKVIAACDKFFLIGGHRVHLSASVGVAISPQDGIDAVTMLRNADTAMYATKANGRNAFQFYTAEMNQVTRNNLVVETGLSGALADGNLFLTYQPKIDLVTGRVIGVEALLRWNDPVLGPVSPARFIPIAEESGLILPIGEWVIAAACKRIAAWRAEGYEVPIAVNLSARQFRQNNLAKTIARLLAETGAPAHCLEIEITESVLLEDTEATAQVLAELKRLGVSISLDDFGTGYASLTYLRRFPFDTVKIDRSFVDGIETDFSNASIVEAIIMLSERLQIKVVAEGIETAEQLAALRERGCRAGQGYYFCRPVSPEKVLEILGSSFFSDELILK
jgi:diguanylate cyclase (GGDEF)-like protein/PAS domain S-box-containing protein